MRDTPVAKIIAARIVEKAPSKFGPLPTVFVTFEDGQEKLLFDYYPDEISFTPGEFLGLTEREAHHLKYEKDRRYLRS